MSLATGTRIGQYEVVGAIGAGGMGEVYRARDAKLNRDVALKILSGAGSEITSAPAITSDGRTVAYVARQGTEE